MTHQVASPSDVQHRSDTLYCLECVRWREDDYDTANHLIYLTDSDETIDNLVDMFFRHYFIDEREEVEDDVTSYLTDEIDDMVCESSNELYITTKDLISMYETFEL